MNHDPLSDVLRSVRLRGAVFYLVSCRDEWVAETPPGSVMSTAVMPGAEHLMAYHMVAKGSGWAALGGLPPVHLATGDIVMFPHGDAHVLSSAPNLVVAPRDAEWVLGPTFAILTSHFLLAARPSRANAVLAFLFHFEYAT